MAKKPEKPRPTIPVTISAKEQEQVDRRAQILAQQQETKAEVTAANEGTLDDDSKEVMDKISAEIVGIADGVENRLTTLFGCGFNLFVTPKIEVKIKTTITATKTQNKWILGIGSQGSANTKSIDVELSMEHVAVPIDSLPTTYGKNLSIKIEDK